MQRNLMLVLFILLFGVVSCGDDDDDDGGASTADDDDSGNDDDESAVDDDNTDDDNDETDDDSTSSDDDDDNDDSSPEECEPPPFRSCRDVDTSEGTPMVSDLKWIVPSEMMPDEVREQPGNNNLDIVEHDCRLFFAFRAAPYHFASAQATIYVLSTTDEENWEYETRINLETDVREPRLWSFDGKLFLYFAVLGDNPAAFEPQGMMYSEYLEPGRWSRPKSLYEEGFIPWRTKVVDGVPYMVGYVGGENIYEMTEGGDPMTVHWLTTSDGVTLEPVIEDQPVVITGGGSETDFVILDDGSLVAVARNEAGDENGFGMNICRAGAEDLGTWECVMDPKKYDSPLMFKHKNRAYLIGRRNVTETGNYDLGMDDLPLEDQRMEYELDYWNQPKRCSLWEVDLETREVSFLLDLPSAGDTCFAGITKICENQYLVYNYTSPLDDLDISWNEGQTGDTLIYSVVLTMP